MIGTKESTKSKQRRIGSISGRVGARLIPKNSQDLKMRLKIKFWIIDLINRISIRSLI